ncbi:hypothetical protein A6A08_11265 [Nocardiopsis sp. TSRI0078]|uniref:maleylpyruvate isomerase family mycothiol-dependent enzyme n=1 Tax=unclassified Nocardiopsis TaxID=2649073 RepID=UPI00093C0F49|nr:maleylpyruvate isomerase family mycothiol-dependent enzyme [Nocardiopsis sp. TSRI0078]OKI15101.1 hypothetical protein A6A08_11265 [Nocardiopsis sp. TSRI0078]
MNDLTRLGAPIDARPHLARERESLLALLRSLGPAEWEAEAVPGWSARDVAAHLLGDDYWRIAGMRDRYRAAPAPAPGEPLAAFVHRNNQEWVRATARISPEALVQTLEMTGREVVGLWRAADPHVLGLGVSWAGADPAPVWLDCARELTEHWAHRQQIRHATGRPTDPGPQGGLVLDTLMRALPHTLRDTPAETGTRVRVAVDGPDGGEWTATRTGAGWSLAHAGPGPGGAPAATVRWDFETAWRLCVRGIGPEEAARRGDLSGDPGLAGACCRIVSIIR